MEIEERRKIEYNLCGYLKTYIKKLCKDNGNIDDIIEDLEEAFKAVL